MPTTISCVLIASGSPLHSLHSLPILSVELENEYFESAVEKVLLDLDHEVDISKTVGNSDS